MIEIIMLTVRKEIYLKVSIALLRELTNSSARAHWVNGVKTK